MILTVNIGNTHITIAGYEHDADVDRQDHGRGLLFLYNVII